MRLRGVIASCCLGDKTNSTLSRAVCFISTCCSAQRPGGIHNHGEVRVANQIPAVHLGKTDKAVYYEQAEVDGIVVYYHPSVAELVGKLTVSLEKLFFMKKLIARATV
jgi:hypothetical protein